MIGSLLSISTLFISNKISFWVSKHIWARLLCIVTGAKTKTLNMDRIKNNNEYVIFCVNHQSLFDIIALYRVLSKPIYFIAKKELKKMPFIGWYVYASGMIFIDRSNRENAMKSIKKAGELIRSGKDVVTFPEGKRSTTGELNLFKRGSFIIAQGSNIKIVPVAIKGSLRVNPPKSLILRPGKITLNFGHPINPADFPDFSSEKLANHTQEKVAELLAEIQ